MKSRVKKGQSYRKTQTIIQASEDDNMIQPRHEEYALGQHVPHLIGNWHYPMKYQRK